MNEKLSKEETKFKLIYTYEDQKQYFQNIYNYVPKLMKYLWEDPKLVSTLLINSDINDIKENLVPFIANNFYSNILSSTSIDEHLMYIITLLLKDEISKTENSNNFLSGTVAGYFLEHLKFREDVKSFFKTSINSILEKLELGSSRREINFNVQEIQLNFAKTKANIEKQLMSNPNFSSVDDIDSNFYRKVFSFSCDNEISLCDDVEWNNALIDSKQKKLFNSKYLTNVDKNELLKLLNDFKKNKNMYDYIELQLKKCNDSPKIYTNDRFYKNIFDSPISNEVLALYQIDFFRVMNSINELFSNFFNNSYLIPYSVKCICKIISLLLKKKLPNITIIERNAYIAKYFFSNLFLPLFLKPGYGTLFNDFIISGRTTHNISIISFVIERFVSGKFFIDGEKEGDFSPFNQYFIEKMPDLLKFFDNITNVKLPVFIEKLINNQLEDNYIFDYFKENQDEIIFHRSICFSFECFLSLLNNLEKYKDILFVGDKNINLQKTIEKLQIKTNQEIINGLKKNLLSENINENNQKMKKIKDKKSHTKTYFLFTDLLINEKYKYLFELTQERPNFILPELKTTNTDEEIKKNNIIKVKNFISCLLYNYRSLIKTDFDDGTTDNMFLILTELKKFMKTSNYVIDGNIPSIWYANTLIEYLMKLPDDLKNNDFEKLFKQIELDVNNSIKKLNFETMSICLEKIKYAQKLKSFYENTENIIKDINLNKKVRSIIETATMPVSINLTFTEKIKDFKIEKSKIKEKQLNYDEIDLDDSKRNKINKNCVTIESFTKIFPNIVKLQELQDEDLFKIEEEINLSDTIQHYINIIEDYLKKLFNIDESHNEFENIINKIYDYIMEKIYEKIYSFECEENDSEIFRNCVLLSWTEPKHFISDKKNYIYDSFLPDVINYFEEIDKEKSPRKKIISMNNIFICINNVIKFNGSNNGGGVDDQLPILNYAFVKARPLHIYSNCKFMELFLGDKEQKEEGSQLANLFLICDFVKDITAEKLNGVSEEEYKKKCQNAAFGNE